LFGEYSVSIQGTFREHSVIRETFRKDLGRIQKKIPGTFREYLGIIQGTFRVPSLAQTEAKLKVGANKPTPAN
jgi:hypothetical protein